MATPIAATDEPHVVDDFRGILKVMSDGTVIRQDNPSFPFSFPSDGSVESKGLIFDPTHSLHVCLYRPVETLPDTRLPILVFFHGGGFCVGSCTWPPMQTVCRTLCAQLSALVLAFDYRLAPEHRLPAAIEDAETALLWLKSQCAGPASESWLAASADLTKVFISGESAGANISHHMATRFGPDRLLPVQIRGFIIISPALFGEDMIPSKSETLEGAFMSWDDVRLFDRLSLPIGANRDHPVVNPFGPESPNLEKVEMGPMLVVAAERDILFESNVDYVRRLKETGKKVELVQIAGEDHAFLSLKPLSDPTKVMIGAIRQFMDRTGVGSD